MFHVLLICHESCPYSFLKQLLLTKLLRPKELKSSLASSKAFSEMSPVHSWVFTTSKASMVAPVSENTKGGNGRFNVGIFWLIFWLIPSPQISAASYFDIIHHKEEKQQSTSQLSHLSTFIPIPSTHHFAVGPDICPDCIAIVSNLELSHLRFH